MANILMGFLIAYFLFSQSGMLAAYKEKTSELPTVEERVEQLRQDAENELAAKGDETAFKDDSVSEEEKQFIVEHPTAVRTVVYEHGKVVESTVHEPNNAEDRSEVPGREPAR